MQKQLVFKCMNGHEVLRLCVQQKCNHPSAICQSQNCIAQQQHSQCKHNINAQVITDILTKKLNPPSKILSLLQNIYHYLLQQTQKYYNQSLKEIKQQAQNLSLSSQKLYTLLSQSNTVYPELVRSILQYSTYTHIHNQFSKHQQIRKMAQKHTKQIDQIFSKVKNLYKNHSQQYSQCCTVQNSFMNNLKFTQQLSGKQTFSILNSQKTIRRIKPYDGHSYFALVFPSLNQCNQTTKVKIKIQNIGYSVGIGIGYFQEMIKNQFKWKDYFGGGASYVMSRNGKVINHNTPQQNQTNTDFRCFSGDLVSLQIDPISSKIIVSNTKNSPNPNSTAVISFMQNTKSLYLCFLMCDQFDQVTIL